jgi:hypothetical protein
MKKKKVEIGLEHIQRVVLVPARACTQANAGRQAQTLSQMEVVETASVFGVNLEVPQRILGPFFECRIWSSHFPYGTCTSSCNQQ